MNKKYLFYSSQDILPSIVLGGAMTLLILLAACTPQTNEIRVPASSLEQATRQIGDEPVASPIASSVPAATPETLTRPTRPTPPALEQVPQSDLETEPVIGEVPKPILDSVLQDAQERMGVSREDITVQVAESVIWNDGSLGCPQPGQMYTQAPVEGYRVVLEIQNDTFNYHVAAPSFFILCEDSLPIPPLQGTPAS